MGRGRRKGGRGEKGLDHDAPFVSERRVVRNVRLSHNGMRHQARLTHRIGRTMHEAQCTLLHDSTPCRLCTVWIFMLHMRVGSLVFQRGKDRGSALWAHVNFHTAWVRFLHRTACSLAVADVLLLESSADPSQGKVLSSESVHVSTLPFPAWWKQAFPWPLQGQSDIY